MQGKHESSQIRTEKGKSAKNGCIYESKLLWGDSVTQNCSYPIYLKFEHHLIKNFYAQVFISFTGRGFFPRGMNHQFDKFSL